MAGQIPVGRAAAMRAMAGDGTHEVVRDVAYQREVIVNVVYYGDPAGTEWVLIDAGLKGAAGRIRRTGEKRFGPKTKPQAIILTHGHIDHVGALKDLAEEWDVPIFAHQLELPYLTGRSSYPPPDPAVGGGFMSAFAGFLPRGPVDVRLWLQALPATGEVPFMPGWRWVHTPGHTPGHISLWREKDRLLIAGDAFITTRQESAFAIAMQTPELHGPPMYYTQDWEAARESVRRLAALRPETVVTGHGPAMQGPEMQSALNILANYFNEVAVPKRGRYVNEPARANEKGTIYIPPKL
jgi:glyoxylase-like metal-dependent hydrolase (beta-lactamase superfamily II)